MKKVIIPLAIVLLGIGVYLGYLGYQRVAINIALKLVLAECNPTDSDPDKAWVKERFCQVVEEENRQFKQAAASSKTAKEFQKKAETLILQWEKENKIGELIEQYRSRKQQK